MPDSSTDSRADFPLDDERVAAFIEGRLEGDERDAVLARLSADPEWREVLMRVTDLDEGTKPALVTERDDAGSTTPNRFRRSWPWLGLAAAASVTFIVMSVRERSAPLLALTRSLHPVVASTIVVEPEQLAALQLQRWSVQRAASDSLTSTSRAIRLGVWAVDAFLDRTGGGQAAREAMVSLLNPVPGSGPAIALLRTAQDSSSSANAFNAVRATVESAAFDVGAWLELVRAGAQPSVSENAAVALVLLLRDAQGADSELVEQTRAVSRAVRDRDTVVAKQAASHLLFGLASPEQ